jgi:hypothetical protein
VAAVAAAVALTSVAAAAVISVEEGDRSAEAGHSAVGDR